MSQIRALAGRTATGAAFKTAVEAGHGTLARDAQKARSNLC
jgi:hypothetical protein